MIQRILILVFAIAMAGGCATSKKTADTTPTEPAATTSATTTESVEEWAYVIKDLPDGDASGVFTLMKKEDKYSGVMKSELGEVDVNNLTIENDVLKCNYAVMGYSVNMTGTFTGDNFKGKINVEGYEFPMTAVKKK